MVQFHFYSLIVKGILFVRGSVHAVEVIACSLQYPYRQECNFSFIEDFLLSTFHHSAINGSLNMEINWYYYY